MSYLPSWNRPTTNRLKGKLPMPRYLLYDYHTPPRTTIIIIQSRKVLEGRVATLCLEPGSPCVLPTEKIALDSRPTILCRTKSLLLPHSPQTMMIFYQRYSVALNGSVRLKHGSPWRDQQDLDDLLLVRHTSNSTSCGVHMVSYTIESIIPLQAVKLYTFTNQRYRAYTNSPALHEYLCEVYNKTSVFGQPTQALLVCVRNSGIDPGNPFDENEITYPLAKESHILLFGQRLGQDASLQVFGQVLRQQFDYTNFYTLPNVLGSVTVSSPLTLGGNPKSDNTYQNNTHAKDDIDAATAAFILDSYRPDLSAASNTNQRKQRSWESTFEKDMERLHKLDMLQDRTKRNRPERTLSFIKRKPFLPRKSTNPTTQQLSTTPLKRSASASASSLSSTLTISTPSGLTPISTTLEPTTMTATVPMTESPTPTPTSAPSHPLMSIHIKRQQSLPSKSIPTSSQPTSSQSTHYDSNKKQLKSAIWSKLLQDGLNKKSDDTIAFYHIIYQSIQYVLRNTFKVAPLDPRRMEPLIESHIQFYRNLENDLPQ
ncbi:hypothetical protein [Absidia glauca]|uniref:Sld7 C-terminal domain-containing protein n=1 Tax=Absidia glauca TaxID=4829 RepID=A0A163THQ4_ABSGL|nr:hypothetical protein [Absidia glauca]